MQNYFSPEFNSTKFTCPHCQVVAAQHWFDIYYNQASRGMQKIDTWRRSRCSHCGGESYWYQERMIVPTSAPVEPMHPDLPESCRPEYDEARDIVSRSPRAAAALIRLALQKLMPILGESGDNINADIGSLVTKGLPPEIQQALDYCRVVGNNAVHPGEIDLNDTPEIAHNLFSMLNFIVEDRISRPKRVANLYGKLPEAARAAVAKRDSN
jgi:hypothetical protein